MSIGPFLDRLFVLDRLTFGPAGMPMPRAGWRMTARSCRGPSSGSPPAERLPTAAAARLELDDGAAGLVPLSMYIAIPALPPARWFGHNLASLNRTLPELSLHGLGSMTKALALKCFRCREQIGATQWGSPALHIHARFGPLELLTAWTPAHSDPATLTYRVAVTDEKLRFALGDPDARLETVPATDAVSAGDERAMQRLQERLEAGERFVITGPPLEEGGTVRVPIARIHHGGTE